MTIKIGVCGCGSFAGGFIALFKAHPLVGEVAIADVVPERVKKHAEKHGIRRTFGSLEELCASDVDAVAIFTQRQLHGPQSLAALRAGKHVYSAVPMGQTVDEIRFIVEEARRRRLIYMTGETSYYYPEAIYCRRRFRNGDFGDVVYAEAHYCHDMSEFYGPFKHSGGPDWKRVAGFPPMYYPTHSVGFVLCVTGAHAESVSCLGWRDNHEDGIFRVGANNYDNVFSNETALLRTSDGATARINEFRRIGRNHLTSVSLSLFGTKACFEANAGGHFWTTVEPKPPEALDELLKCRNVPVSCADANLTETERHDFHMDISPQHSVERLPPSFRGLRNGHCGSHQFLVDDFVKGVAAGALPPNHAWDSARYCVPGLIAHESAKQEGARLPVPDFGDPPADWTLLNPDGK